MKKQTIHKIVKIGAIGAGLGLLWYGIKRGAKSLVFGVQNYSISAIDLSEGTAALNLNLSIRNPLMVGVTIRGITGDVYVEDRLVGRINMRYDYFISGGKTHVIPIIVNLDLSQIGPAIMANITSGDINTLDIKFDGKVAVTNCSVPIPVKLNMNYGDLRK